MLGRISVGKSGLVLGVVMGGYHLCWSALVAAGWAQAVIDFVFWMHFIKPVFVVESFDIVRALILVGVTGAIGGLFGSIFAWIWNALHPV
jgi:hypothetical protein